MERFALLKAGEKLNNTTDGGFMVNMRMPNRRGPLPHGSTKSYIGAGKNKVQTNPDT